MRDGKTVTILRAEPDERTHISAAGEVIWEKCMVGHYDQAVYPLERDRDVSNKGNRAH